MEDRVLQRDNSNLVVGNDSLSIDMTMVDLILMA